MPQPYSSCEHSKLCHWASVSFSCLQEVDIGKTTYENPIVEHLNYQQDKLGYDLLILSRNSGKSKKWSGWIIDFNCMQKPDLKFADTRFFNWTIPRDTHMHGSYLISMVINCTAYLKGPGEASPQAWLGLLSSHLLTSLLSWFFCSFPSSTSVTSSILCLSSPPVSLLPVLFLFHPNQSPSLLCPPLSLLSLCCFSNKINQGIPSKQISCFLSQTFVLSSEIEVRNI